MLYLGLNKTEATDMESRPLLKNEPIFTVDIDTTNGVITDEQWQRLVRCFQDFMARYNLQRCQITMLPGEHDIVTKLTAFRHAVTVNLQDNDHVLLRLPPDCTMEKSRDILNALAEHITAKNITLIAVPARTELLGVDPSSALWQVMDYNRHAHTLIQQLEKEKAAMAQRIEELEKAGKTEPNDTKAMLN